MSARQEERMALEVRTAVEALRRRDPIVATMAQRAPRRLSRDGALARVDGEHVVLHPERWLALPADERAVTLARVALQGALHHPRRRGARDAGRWRVAADLVVQALLIRAGLALGGSAPAVEGKSVEEVYALLGEGDGDAPDALAPDDEEAPRPTVQGAFAGLPGEPLPHSDGVARAGSTAAAEARWRDALEREEGRSNSGAAGLGAASEQRAVEPLPPRLDWRVMLWRFVARTPTDFGGFDRRFVGRGLYLDALDRARLRVLVAVDTSSSIPLHLLARFVAELRAIARAYPHVRCTLFYADSAVHGCHDLGGHEVPPAPVGGGGTDFRPFFAAVEDAVEPAEEAVVVYLSDGDGTYPPEPPSPPVLWVVPSGGRPIDTFPFGEVVPLLG